MTRLKLPSQRWIILTRDIITGRRLQVEVLCFVRLYAPCVCELRFCFIFIVLITLLPFIKTPNDMIMQLGWKLEIADDRRKLYFFFCGAAAHCGPCFANNWGFRITHNDAPQTVGLNCTSDKLVKEISTWQHTKNLKKKKKVPPAGFYF